jgi:hypothetical protein
MIRDVHPGSGFFSHLGSGSCGQKITGSGSATLLMSSVLFPLRCHRYFKGEQLLRRSKLTPLYSMDRPSSDMAAFRLKFQVLILTKKFKIYCNLPLFTLSSKT